jgi:predicted AAA+ superfamily ATPase
MQEILRTILAEWHESWVPEFKPREFDYGLIRGTVRKIYTFAGCRRAGKTYTMFQIIDWLNRELGIERKKIFYIDFEDERIPKRTEALTSLVPVLMEFGEGEMFLFLDEIHEIPNWERWLRRVYDSYRNIKIFASGSSSKLAAKEIPTALRGRALSFEVFPLSFREFLSFKGLPYEKETEYTDRMIGRIRSHLKEYLQYGGFPEVVMEEDLRIKRMIVQEYFRTIVGRDIAERYGVKNFQLLSNFLKYLLNSTYFSIYKVYNSLRSAGQKAGKGTLFSYLEHAESVYFTYTVPIFSRRIKDQMAYPRKIYFVDNSFINFVGIKFSENFGRLAENAVYLHLRRQQAMNPELEIYYWKSRDGREVDFVLKKGLEVNQLIQVCWDPTDEETRKREIGGLVKALEEFGLKRGLVLTGDFEGHEEIKGKEVLYRPMWKWLLSGTTTSEAKNSSLSGSSSI